MGVAIFLTFISNQKDVPTAPMESLARQSSKIDELAVLNSILLHNVFLNTCENA